MTELDVARAIRDGELPSPQKFGDNLWLFAMRITGTGVAFRAKHNEFVLRDPALYLNNDFLERCQGLPVIVEHPKNGTLDSEEFAKRVVGSVMLPYIKGDSVWCIARVYDQQVADAMQSGQLSTSPAVMLVKEESQKAELKDKTLLIESEAAVLDHLAICIEGVWDKGGGPTGIAVTKRSDAMDDTEKGGMPLDKLLERLDGIGEQLAGCTKRMDAMGQRLDALDKKRTEESNDPGEATRVVADSDEETDPRYHIRMADAQQLADRAYTAWGERAPKNLIGEKLSNFRKRLLRPHIKHSQKYKAADLELVTDPHIFTAVEREIYADSIAASMKPESIGPGRLRMVTERTAAGHTINKFYGSTDWLNQFAGNRYVVKRIDPKPQRDLALY